MGPSYDVTVDLPFAQWPSYDVTVDLSFYSVAFLWCHSGSSILHCRLPMTSPWIFLFYTVTFLWHHHGSYIVTFLWHDHGSFLLHYGLSMMSPWIFPFTLWPSYDVTVDLFLYTVAFLWCHHGSFLALLPSYHVTVDLTLWPSHDVMLDLSWHCGLPMMSCWIFPDIVAPVVQPWIPLEAEGFSLDRFYCYLYKYPLPCVLSSGWVPVMRVLMQSWDPFPL